MGTSWGRCDRGDLQLGPGQASGSIRAGEAVVRRTSDRHAHAEQARIGLTGWYNCRVGRTSDARQRLIDSAGKLIHERGYNAVGVGEICSKAGVNKGSFYHFFPSKQQLVLEVVDAVWRATRDQLEAELLGHEPPLVRLVRYFDAVLARHRVACELEGVQNGCPVGNLALEMSTQDPQLRDRLLQTIEGHAGYFERITREAKTRDEIDSGLDPRQAAENLVALMEGKILVSKLRNDPESLSDLASAALRLLGVRQRPGSEAETGPVGTRRQDGR